MCFNIFPNNISLIKIALRRKPKIRSKSRQENQTNMALIKHVHVSDKNPTVGQSILIEVECKDPKTEVNINGAHGVSRFIQFTSAGIHEILIVARLGKSVKCHSETIKVSEKNKTDPIYPLIYANMSPYTPRTVMLTISNAKTELLDVLRYTFDFGDGMHGISENGFISHDYSDSLIRDEYYTTYTVRVDAEHRDKSLTSALSTLTLSNLYAVNKLDNKILTPWVTANHHPLPSNGNVDCSFTITNIEDEEIIFTDEKHEWLVADKPEPLLKDKFILYAQAKPQIIKQTSLVLPTFHSLNLKIAPRSTLKVTRSFPWAQFKKDTFGVAIHLGGRGVCSKLNVIASAYIEVRLPLEWSTTINDYSVVAKLKIISRYLGKKTVTHDELSEIIQSNKLLPKTQVLNNEIKLDNEDNVQPAIQGKIKSQLGKIIDTPPSKFYDLTGAAIISAIYDSISLGIPRSIEADPPPVPGNDCDPDNVPDPDNLPEGMVCQATGEVKWRIVPGRLLKAKKGDMIIDPGGSGIIGQLLSQLSQKYSHCGIMTKNHVELIHSTASQDWLLDNKKKHMSGIEGVLGFYQSTLTYLWPGTVKQSIDQAIHGSDFPSPEGKVYQIADFSFKPASLSDRVIVNPLVIKPNPFFDTHEVRLKLHSIAEEALKIKSHYRLFCYTKADIALSPAGTAGPEAGWANDSVATVCSSFIWLAAQKAGIQLEGANPFTNPGDLESADTSNNAAIGLDSSGINTRDGLYFYTEESRRAVVQWLHNYVKKMVSDQIPSWISINPLDWIGATAAFIEDTADNIANQICNTFAFDWNSDEAEASDNWKNPGTGNAVSPDNLMFWDSPDSSKNNNGFTSLYGYYEEAIYMPGGWAPVDVFKWKHIETKGTLTGTVVGSSGCNISGAEVSISGFNPFVVDSNGKFRFDNVPTGPCHVTVEFIDSNGVGYPPIESNPDIPIIEGQTSDITLVIPCVPPYLVRLVTIDVNMETNWSSISAHNVPGLKDSKSIKLDPVNHPTGHLEFDDNDNMGHPHGKLFFDIQLQNDGSINVSYNAQEIDDEVEGGTGDTWNVQRDWWRSLSNLTVSNGDPIDNDATNFNFVIHNDQA